MRVEVDEPCPTPEDSLLAEAALSLQETGSWGWVVDNEWRVVFNSDEQRLSFGGSIEKVAVVVGEHLFGPEVITAMTQMTFGPNTTDVWRDYFRAAGGLVLADTSGGRERLRALVDPRLQDLVDELSTNDVSTLSFSASGHDSGGMFEVRLCASRIRDRSGRLRGTIITVKPAAGMSLLSTMALQLDAQHVRRMQMLAQAGRRPVAIMFGDLEGSTVLSRRLPSSRFFALGRRLIRVADSSVVQAGGLPGRHAGDGVVAFFATETSSSESAAARGCIAAALALRREVRKVAVRSDLAADELTIRFGLHWGATPYMGNIATVARTEVTALGDEVNETARIEACATGGRILASRPLIERLTSSDASALGLDPSTLAYTPLGDLQHASRKARRDAAMIEVTELFGMSTNPAR